MTKNAPRFEPPRPTSLMGEVGRAIASRLEYAYKRVYEGDTSVLHSGMLSSACIAVHSGSKVDAANASELEAFIRGYGMFGAPDPNIIWREVRVDAPFAWATCSFRLPNSDQGAAHHALAQVGPDSWMVVSIMVQHFSAPAA